MKGDARAGITDGIPPLTDRVRRPHGRTNPRICDWLVSLVLVQIFSEPIQEEVESGESVVIPYWRLIRTGAPDVEAGTPPGGGAIRPSLSE